jgi:hypothetical protein
MNSRLRNSLLVLAASVALPLSPVFAADLLIANYSFEDSLTGTWTQTFGGANPNGSTAAVTEQADEGATSLKIVDSDGAGAFGMESAKLTISAGTTYIVHARVRIVSGNADLYVRFYNNTGGVDQYVAADFTSISIPTNEWTNLQVKMTAPANTNRVSVLLYSSAGNIGTAYWDRISITRQYTDLGVQVFDSAANGTTFGKGAHAHEAFSVVTGAGPYLPELAVIDTNTETVISTVTFPADAAVPTGAWTATTADDSAGNIYFGTYSNAGLYRHVPGSTAITRVATAPTGNTIIYGLASSGASDGKIYGGTFNGGRIFKYTPTGGMVQLAPSGSSSANPFIAGMQYVRELDFDPVQQAVYFSTGGNGTGDGVYRWDVLNGNLNALISTTSLASSITVAGGRVFANIASVTTVLNVSENPDGTFASVATDATFSATSPVSPVNGGKVYYVGGGSLYDYDIAAKTSTNLNKSLTTSARVKRFAWVNGVLVGITTLSNRTYVMKYNPSTGAFSHNPVASPVKIPGVLNEVQGGPDGKIYTSAYLTGGLGVYTPDRGDANDATEEQMFSGLGQIDRMAAHNGKLYLGVYPGALAYEYNPALSWGGGNPRFLINGSTNGQDRPKAFAFDDAGTKVFMGSVAKTSQMDGAVTWYDFASQTTGVSLVANQSVIALACWGTKLFAGTSTRPGYNAVAVPDTTAKIRVYDITSGGITLSTTLNMPSPGTMRSVTKMIVIGTGSAARIWGFADGYLFVLNPATNAFDYVALKFSDVSYGTLGTYRDADLVQIAKDPGNLYGTIHGTYLFRINLATKAVTTITSGADMVTADGFGDIYYNRTADETTLGRYSP